MNMDLDINHIRVGLHGVSTEMVEAAVDGLEDSLRRRLAVLAAGGQGLAVDGPLDIAELSLGITHKDGVTDAAALRELIAERLLEGLGQQLRSGQ